MRYLACHENAVRGTFDFPVARYHVDAFHPRYDMPFHWHDECELIRVQRGEFLLSLDGERLRVGEGDCAFIPGGMIHGGEPRDAVYECLVLDMERLLQGSTGRREQYAAALGNGTAIQRVFAARSEAAQVIASVFAAMANEQPGYEFLTTGLLWQWLGLVLGQNLVVMGKEPASRRHEITRLKNVLRRIRQDYSSALTLAELAAQANMTAPYFCRVFRQATGRSPIDYLNYYRIECAAEMLRATQDSVTEIALACGFNDLSYFIRLFRKHKGMTPGKYRGVTPER